MNNLIDNAFKNPTIGATAESTPMFSFQSKIPVPNFKNAFNVKQVLIAPHLGKTDKTSQQMADDIPKEPGETRTPLVNLADQAKQAAAKIASPEYFANSIDVHDSGGNYVRTYTGQNAYQTSKKQAAMIGGAVSVSNPYGSIGRIFSGAWGAVDKQITDAADKLATFTQSVVNPKSTPQNRVATLVPAVISGLSLAFIPFTAAMGAAKETAPGPTIEGKQLPSLQSAAKGVDFIMQKIGEGSSFEVDQGLSFLTGNGMMKQETADKIKPIATQVVALINSIAAGVVVADAPAKIVAASDRIASVLHDSYREAVASGTQGGFVKNPISGEEATPPEQGKEIVPKGQETTPANVPKSRFETGEDIVNYISRKGAGFGAPLNVTEMRQLVDHFNSLGEDAATVNLWGKKIDRGTIYKSYGGGIDIVLGKVTDSRFGGETVLVGQMNKNGTLDGRFRTHGSAIEDAEIIGKIDLSNPQLTNGVPKNTETKETNQSDVEKTLASNPQKYDTGNTTKDLNSLVADTDKNIETNPEGKTRKFVTTVKESPMTAEEVKAKVQSTYDPISNKDTLASAQKIIDTSRDDAMKMALDESTPATAQSNAVAQLLIKDAQDKGNYTEAVNLVETTARRATTQGQAIQSLSMYNRLTPEGVLRYAQKVIDNAKAGEKVKITPDIAKTIVDHSKKVSEITDPEDKAVETAKLLKEINDLVPVSMWKKLSTIQSLFQLLNPKTIVRKWVGDLGITSLENIKDVPAVALDKATSLITGERAKGFQSIKVQAKGFATGMRQGIRDGIEGIATGGTTQGGPYSYGFGNRTVLKSAVGKALTNVMNTVFTGTSRAYYQAAYDGALYEQMALHNTDVPTEAMQEIAHNEGLRRTYQDDSLVSRLFVGLKKAFNVGQDFGLGDFIIKYPKVPGNILARGIEYSPAGFVKTIYEAAKPLMGKKFDQRSFSSSFGRAITGTVALTGTGALLHHIGIIIGAEGTNKSVNDLQKEQGITQYQVNISALKRFALGGAGDPSLAKMQPGDTLMTYDWMQPFAMAVSIGANLDQFKSGKGGVVNSTLDLINNLPSGIDTLGNQPVFQDVLALFKYGGGTISGAARQVFLDAPESFAPTFLNQIKELIDNTSRQTYSPNTLQYAWNLAKNRIPGLAETLPPRVGIFGKDEEMFQGKSNNPFNVLFNPAFVTHYTQTPESKMVIDLINNTGETKETPKVENLTQTINGKSVKLTPNQITSMQRYVGTITQKIFGTLAINQNFQKIPDDEKVKLLSGLLTDIGTAGRIIILGNRPKKVSGAALSLVKGTIPDLNQILQDH